MFVINKIDLIDGSVCEWLVVLLCGLNLCVWIEIVEFGKVLFECVFDIGLFDFDVVLCVLGWL